jgi:hypothetical protein
MDDPRTEITKLEARIEELADIIERCRKIILVSKVAITVGAVLIVAVMFGAIRFDPVIMVGAITVVIGGAVLLGSNSSTSEQTTAALRAAEAERAALIDQIDLREVGGGNGTHLLRL